MPETHILCGFGHFLFAEKGKPERCEKCEGTSEGTIRTRERRNFVHRDNDVWIIQDMNGNIRVWDNASDECFCKHIRRQFLIFPEANKQMFGNSIDKQDRVFCTYYYRNKYIKDPSPNGAATPLDRPYTYVEQKRSC